MQQDSNGSVPNATKSVEIATQGRKSSNTTPKQLGGCTGKGFVKGDPRINRNGRPRSFDAVRALAQKLAREQSASGELAITEVLRRWRDSPEPSLQQAFVAYAFGKVPDKLETTGLENKTNLVLHFDHERGVTSDERTNGTRLPASVP